MCVCRILFNKRLKIEDSSGIGAATSVLFARLGAKLALTGRNEANLQRTCDECVRVRPADTEQPLLVIAELSSEADVARLVDTTIKKFGRLDVLVNNAGIFEFGSIVTTSLEQFDRIMNVNVRIPPYNVVCSTSDCNTRKHC